MTSNSFAKTICSICYEDLKPIVEDLQVITICGHVLHELCLQQWFEYCSGKKKYSCPVCKQRCQASDVARLYFQSLGDSAVSQCQEKVLDPELLDGEIRRLEGKLSVLASTVDSQGKEIKQLNGELYDCKEQLRAELVLKNEVVQQKAVVQQTLLFKSQELNALKTEHLKLQERSMALAKELAALKLASDLNLDEDEILKLASFGNEVNAKHTIDILRKSLATRNKSYQELMAKCIQLGRGEARSTRKLEKAKDKITRLKSRIQEVEMAVELKENQALRLLKTSNETNSQKKISGEHDDKSCTPSSDIFRSRSEMGKVSSASVDCLTQTPSLGGNANKRRHLSNNKAGLNFSNEPLGDLASGERINNCIIIDEDASQSYPVLSVHRDLDLEHTTGKQETKVNSHDKAGADSVPVIIINEDKDSTTSANAVKEVSLGHRNEVCPMINIKKECSSSASSSKPDICFSSGLLGPDGTTRYLGRWCKRVQNKDPEAAQSTNTNRRDLIAVGADGRGGRVKVLRSMNQALTGGSENSMPAKKCKIGVKTSVQSRGCLQIEHFFGKSKQ
ncbi:hypothetical protein LINGRAHAP2_LOCUS14808 [Linum grandiflorum]